MILPILAYGHPILRKKCKSIDKNSKEIKKLQKKLIVNGL